MRVLSSDSAVLFHTPVITVSILPNRNIKIYFIISVIWLWFTKIPLDSRTTQQDSTVRVKTINTNLQYFGLTGNYHKQTAKVTFSIHKKRQVFCLVTVLYVQLHLNLNTRLQTWNPSSVHLLLILLQYQLYAVSRFCCLSTSED